MKIRRKRLKTWHPAALRGLEDEKFIQLFATTIADRTDLREGELLIENRIKHGPPPEAIELLCAEATRRGIDTTLVTQRVAAEAMAGQSFISQLLAPASWKRYEIKAAQALLAILKDGPIDERTFDARVVGRITGQERQVDLMLTQRNPRHVVACEFRDYPERLIAVEKVEAFASKLRDVDANRGVLVTPCGYQPAAIATAKHYQIELFRFHEVRADEARERFADAADVADETRCWVLEDVREQVRLFTENA
jgi:hypothetical protein